MENSTRSTIRDVAKLANAPVNMVMKVALGQPGVNEITRRKIYEAMEALGMSRTPDQHIDSQRTIGVVVPRISEDYIGGVVTGFSETTKSLGYSPVVNVQGLDWEDDMVRLLGSGGAEGVVVVVPHNYDRLIALCHEYHRPYVLVDYQGDDDNNRVPTVEVNNRNSIMQIMHHLFELGHTRIGFITGRREHASAQQRLQGYFDALSEAGIPYDPELVGEGNWEHPLAYQISKRFLQLATPPTAIVASNDLSAFGVMQAANEAGLVVGTDLSVTGFDDINMAATVSPPLTTVRQPFFKLGAVAAEMLIKCLNGETLSRLHVQLDTELVIRQSTSRVVKHTF
jgi:LacI family transcriptional regulator